MAATSRIELVDRVLDGQLAATLADWRAQGLTYDEISARFATDHDLKVSREAVRRWIAELVEPTEAAS